jgi:hypothetical protein
LTKLLIITGVELSWPVLKGEDEIDEKVIVLEAEL